MKLNFKIVKGDIERSMKDQKRNRLYLQMLMTPKEIVSSTKETTITMVASNANE